VLTLAGIGDAERKAARIVVLETRIARAHATRAESLEVRHAAPWKRTEFGKHAPGLDWTAFFSAAGLQQQPTVVVWQPAAIKGIAALVKQVPLSTWKEWLTFHCGGSQAAGAPPAPSWRRTSPSTARSSPERPSCPRAGSERWEAIGELRSKQVGFREEAGMGNAVGKLYVARHFPPSAKGRSRRWSDRSPQPSTGASRRWTG
jgi:putative endopeptidase